MRLVALDEMAEAIGLYVGQTLADARALVPALEVVDEDDGRDKTLLESIAGWCERYTPLVALDGFAGLFLDITGCAHLFGGEARLVEDLLIRLTAQGIAARAAVADTPGGAWAVARYGGQGAAIVPDGGTDRAIAPLPLTGLRIDHETVLALKQVGLRTIGCIADLPRAPLAARFGALLLRRLDQALGREKEAICPHQPVAELSYERKFADLICMAEDIERTIAHLAHHLESMLEKRGMGARSLELKLFRVDGEQLRLAVRTAAPLRDPIRITGLFRERIAGLHDDLDVGFGFDLVRLDVTASDRLDASQIDLVDDRSERETYHALVDRLGARLGPDRVMCFHRADTHIPERTFALAPIASAALVGETSNPKGSQARTRAGRSGRAIAGPSAARKCREIDQIMSPEADPLTRPILLLTRPEMIDVIAAVPEGPPTRFRWRKALYRVERCEGPERIACEWWRDGRAAHSRDYFRVEDDEGYRFWLFRHGLYGRETAAPKWYMHGLFP